MKLTITLLLIACSYCYSQNDKITGLIGKTEQVQYINGNIIQKTVTNPEYAGYSYIHPQPSPGIFSSAGSMVRWTLVDAIAIGSRNATSANGLFEVAGWDLNTERISLYNNSSSTPLWEHPSNTNTNLNNVAISNDGSYIVNGSYHNIYVFNNSSSTPVFDFNLETQLPDTGIAGPVDITSDGNFIIACASRNDSSWIFCFNRLSTNWIWRHRVGQTAAGGAGIQGVRISGNDSTVIVNTYGGFHVFRTYTGQLLGQGLINPLSNSGTQFPQGISGNGNIIATINYSGYLRVHQWNGSAYTLLWQHQEPPGTFFNWMTAVDVSYDGSLIACGTLNFVTSSSFDGKIKLFRTTNSGTPLWTYTGAGDQVGSVSLSKDGKILAAATWGDLSNANNDLLVFKTSFTAPAPIFGVNSPGSFFWCSVSDNGSTVTASGKRVHARTFGNGGEVYNVFIDTSDVPLGIINNSVPSSFELHQNYPNPFNPATKINFSLPERGFVTLKVYDMLGREVKQLVNGDYSGGTYSVNLSADDLSSGVYIYSLEHKSENGNIFKDAKKMTLLK
jgi:hypothetical protein